MDLQVILSEVITRTNEIFHAEAGSVALLEAGGHEIVIRAAVGAGADAVRGRSLPVSKGVIGWVATYGQPALIPDVTQDDRFYRQIDKESGFHTKSILCVPMKANQNTIGVIELMNMSPAYLNETGLNILSVIADHAALAIENARLLAQTRQQAEEQALLFEAMAMITSDLGLDTVLDAVSRQMVEALKADVCLISRWQPNEHRLVTMQSYTWSGLQKFSQPERQLDSPLLQSILESRRPIVIEQHSRLSAPEAQWLKLLNVEALLVVPLIFRRQVIGLVEIGCSQADRPITASELRLAETMAAQAAVAIEHARLYNEATRRLAEAKVLQEVMVAAASSLDFDQILNRTIDALHRNLGIERLQFFLPDQASQQMVAHPSGRLATKEAATWVPLENSAVGQVLRTGQSLIIPIEDNHWQPDEHRPATPTSGLAVPVWLDEKVVAVLYAESSRPRPFDQEDLRLFRAIAAELGVALENAQFFEKERRLVKQQQALLDIFTDLSAELQPDVLFQRIIERAIEVIPNADAGSLLIPKGNEFVFAAAVGFDITRLQNFTLKEEDFLISKLRANQPDQRPVDVHRFGRADIVELNQRFFDGPAEFLAAARMNELQSTIQAQLRVGDDILGTLNIDSLANPNAFTAEDEQTLLLFANQAAIALQNARLFDEIKAAEANYRDLFDNANDLIFTLDSNLRLSRANKMLLNSLDYSLNELIGSPVTNFLTKPQQEDLFKLLKQHLKAAQPPGPFELTVTGHNRQEKLLEVTMRVQRQRDRPVRLDCIARDITRRRDLERRLRQTERLSAIGRLVAGVAHELNNPLTSIIGYASLLQESNLSPNHQEDLRIIFRQAERARIIVRDLLTFARSIELKTQEVNVNLVIEQSVALTTPQTEAANIAVSLALDPGLPLTVADPRRLEQVFVNLIDNAVQVLKTNVSQPQLTFESRRRHDHILITFADNGPGIPTQILNRIFDPFFSTRQVGEGTGLGLSICFGIISEHNGRIWAENMPARGTKFFIELPLTPALHQQQPAISTSAPAPQNADAAHLPGRSLKILVIDDEPFLRTLLERVIKKLGYQVTSAANGQIALNLLATDAYDLVICDMLMPDISGPEVYQQVALQFPHLARRFVFITGNTVDIKTRNFLEKTEMVWLAKPFLPGDISSAIDETISRNQTMQNLAVE